MRKFTKTMLPLFIAGITGFAAHAKSVDENSARLVGANFLMMKGVSGVTAPSDLSISYIASTQSGNAVVADYYVFNITNGKGFVMVSADDIIMPVLAYSDESLFDYDNIASSTKYWIDGYRNQIAAAITYNVPPRSATSGQWAELLSATSKNTRNAARTTDVSPLVTTTWNQVPGYNQDCPNTSSTGGLSVTGCVATAMAQVMKFWNWPTVGCAYHTYFDSYSSVMASGSNTWNPANFGTTAYNWSAMSLTASGTAVNQLMYDAGVSVNMSYSANESGSYVDLPQTPFPNPNCAEYALKTYFHYANTLHSLLRYGIPSSTGYYTGNDLVCLSGQISINGVAEAAWIDTLQAELNAGRPMLYEGRGTDGGHCWVCDGYQASGDMFHFNWGWGGLSNGNFTVDALAPSALGAGGGSGNFNDDQGVILGIKPKTFPVPSTANLKLLSFLNNTVSTPMPYSTPFTITAKVFNSATSNFAGSLGIQLYDSGAHAIAVIDSVNGISVLHGDSSGFITFKCVPYAVTPFIYSGFQLVYKPTGSTLWQPVANNGSFINFGAVGTLNDTDITLTDSLHIGNHNIRQYRSLTVKTDLYNLNNFDFNGSLEAILVNTANGDTFIIQQVTGVPIASGSAITITFTNSNISVAPGLYALEVKHQYGGSGSYYTSGSTYYMNPVLVKVQTASQADVSQVTASSADMFVYPNPASNVLSIVPQGLTVNNIEIMDVQGRVVKTVDQSSNTTITISVNDLAPGLYFVQAATDQGKISRKITIVK